MANTIKIRGGLEANRSGITPVARELICTTDENKLYLGDGTTAGGNPIENMPTLIDQDVAMSAWFTLEGNTGGFSVNLPSLAAALAGGINQGAGRAIGNTSSCTQYGAVKVTALDTFEVVNANDTGPIWAIGICTEIDAVTGKVALPGSIVTIDDVILSLTPGLPVYVGLGGLLTQTAHTTAGYWNQVIGIAYSTEHILVNPMMPIQV
tara:strand:- start:539 stop:1162 length:624 start_codon:yes stop_codon:yes gene_type:complete